jgi:5-methylcytosine-specific restriction protein A
MRVMFEVGKTYIRRQLHDQYGGQRQGGISTPARHPLILLFSGSGGEKWGYRDHWDPDGSFRFSGEGQRGNMEFRAGNKAIRDHAGNGKQLHLFGADGRGHARYVGQMVYSDHDLVTDVPDGGGDARTAIVFHLEHAS